MNERREKMSDVKKDPDEKLFLEAREVLYAVLPRLDMLATTEDNVIAGFCGMKS